MRRSGRSSVRNVPYVTGSEAKVAAAAKKNKKVLSPVEETETEVADGQDIDLTINYPGYSILKHIYNYGNPRISILESGFYGQQYTTIEKNITTINTLIEGDGPGIRIYFFNADDDSDGRYAEFNKNPSVKLLKNKLWSLLGNEDNVKNPEEISQAKKVILSKSPTIHIAIFPQMMLQTPGGFDDILTETDAVILKNRQIESRRIIISPFTQASASEGGSKKRRTNRRTRTKTRKTKRKTKKMKKKTKKTKRKYSKK